MVHRRGLHARRRPASPGGLLVAAAPHRQVPCARATPAFRGSCPRHAGERRACGLVRQRSLRRVRGAIRSIGVRAERLALHRRKSTPEARPRNGAYLCGEQVLRAAERASPRLLAPRRQHLEQGWRADRWGRVAALRGAVQPVRRPPLRRRRESYCPLSRSIRTCHRRIR